MFSLKCVALSTRKGPRSRGLHHDFEMFDVVINSTVMLQVQAVFPQGALTKKIKVGLQVNMFRPRKGVASNGLKKITVNHVPKKKRFCLIW